MKKATSKKTSQVNTSKRKKDFLKWMFGCSSNAISMAVKYYGTDLDSPESVMELIIKKWHAYIKDKK